MNLECVDFSKQDILIVDDTPDNLRVLSSMLEKQGYNVRQALNGQMALKTCQSVSPRLILLDIMMPNMDGYQVCQELKANDKSRDIPVIFISALDDIWDKVKAFNVGGVDYITKPFHVEEVLARVRNQLTIRELHQRLSVQNVQLQQLNRELYSTNRELKRSNAELEQFAYMISHDLQSPLQSVSLSLEIISSTYKDSISAPVEKHVVKSLNGTRKIQHLIKDLLEYSRLGKGDRELELTDCKAVLEEVLANLEWEISSSGAKINYSELPTVMGDRVQLIRLFQNLISNAIKFRRPQVLPTVEISAAAHSDGKWLIGVHDNGIGITPEHFDRIFGIFQRLHTSEEYPGTGIGTSICKKIVEHHGGSIWVESQVGLGTIFYFTIPSSR